MRKDDRHLIRSKERIEILETELERALSFCSPKVISRKGYKFTVKTELTPRDPKENNLAIEVVFDVNLVDILTCSDCNLMEIIKLTCSDRSKLVRNEIIKRGMLKYFHCYWI